MLGDLKHPAAHIANTVPLGLVVTRRRRPYEEGSKGRGGSQVSVEFVSLNVLSFTAGLNCGITGGEASGGYFARWPN